MTQKLGSGKTKILIPTIAIIIIIAIGFLALNNFFAEPNQTINEASNDLQINIDQTSSNPPTYDPTTPTTQGPSSTGTTSSSGSSSSTSQLSYDIAHKEMIDVLSATIQNNLAVLSVDIEVNAPIVKLGSQESAYFDMILILENDQETLQTYELIVDMNSTGTFCSVRDVQTKTQQTSSVAVDGSTLTITANLQELPEATMAEWSIVSAYEAMANNQLIYSAYDFTPNEGLKTTVFAHE